MPDELVNRFAEKIEFALSALAMAETKNNPAFVETPMLIDKNLD